MKHRLVTAIERALGWDGPGALGTAFARGHLADDDLPARLLTPHRLLDVVMRRHLANPQIRCFADGGELHPSRYLTDVVNRRRQSFRQADMAALGQMFNEGGTLVLDSVNVFDPTMEIACRALSWWTGELVSVNSYLAVGDTAGFRMHWDDHDVICVQLAGEKSWEIRSTSRPVPMYRDTEQNLTPPDDVVWSGTMQTGDVMHIPRGYWHTATRVGSGEGCSLHLTFGITQRTGVTWANFLSDVARGDELFRTDVVRTTKADADELTARLTELAREYDPQRYRAELRATLPPARHMPFIPALGPVRAVAAVTEFEPVITTDDDRVNVVAGGKKLTFAHRAAPLLHVLLSGHPVPLDQAGADAMQLADILIQEGLCAPLTDESSSGYTGLLSPATFSKELPTSV